MPDGTASGFWIRWRAMVLTLAGILLVGLLAWLLVGRGGAVETPGRIGRRAVAVGTARATVAAMPIRLTAIGTVQPVVTATVRTQLAGTLFSIDFSEGQRVVKGQTLAQIDPRPYRLALGQAEANLARDAAQLNLAKLDLVRYQALLAEDSIARQQVETQAATVKQLAGTLAADRAAIGTARLNLAYTSIRAPASGRIGLRQVDVGNYVTPADANGLAIITQTDPIDVSFALPQDQLATIEDKAARGGGLPVTATDQAGTTTLAQGRFLTLDNQVDASSGTVKAKARFANAGGALFPNQFVNVALLADTVQAVTVPVSAVRHGASGDFVFVLRPDRTVKLTPVRTGPADTARIAVLSGVPAGATVITEGADGLDDGAHVMLAGDAPPGAHGHGGKGHGHRRSAGQ
jgi:multidrug efflux system membrane fusion protein